jgi:maltodextrin utilization protein YvdJ
MILAVLVVLIGIISIVAYVITKAQNYRIMALVSVFVIALMIPVYVSNVNVKAYLISTYDVNAGVYEVAADKTASYLSTDEFTNQIIAGSLEKTQLASVISQRIAEWRDVAAGYNQTLTKYQIWANNPFVSVLWPDIPSGLKYLVIQ